MYGVEFSGTIGVLGEGVTAEAVFELSTGE